MKPWEYSLVIWSGAGLGLAGAAATVYGVLDTGDPAAGVFLGGPTVVAAAVAGIAARARRESFAEQAARDLEEANEREDWISSSSAG